MKTIAVALLIALMTGHMCAYAGDTEDVIALFGAAPEDADFIRDNTYSVFGKITQVLEDAVIVMSDEINRIRYWDLSSSSTELDVRDSEAFSDGMQPVYVYTDTSSYAEGDSFESPVLACDFKVYIDTDGVRRKLRCYATSIERAKRHLSDKTDN